MKFLRRGPSPHQTALAMIGAKPGNSVLVLGAADADLAAELALVTGLNGRTVVVDRAPGAQARIEAAAGRAGALVEFVDAPLGMLPLDADQFEIVVVTGLAAAADSDRALMINDAFRVLMRGGRLLAISGAKRPGLFGLVSISGPKIAPDRVLTLLKSTGAQAIRLLAEADGVDYFEARKAR